MPWRFQCQLVKGDEPYLQQVITLSLLLLGVWRTAIFLLLLPWPFVFLMITQLNEWLRKGVLFVPLIYS